MHLFKFIFTFMYIHYNNKCFVIVMINMCFGPKIFAKHTFNLISFNFELENLYDNNFFLVQCY